MRWTIRAKLTLLVLAVLLPLMAGAAVKFWLDVEEGRRAARADMQDTALAVARNVDDLLNGQAENLEVLASVPGLDRIQDEDLRTAAARVGENHAFVHRLYAADPSGRMTAASSPDGPRKPASFPDPDMLASVLATRQPHVGAPRPAGADGRPIITLGVPALGRDGVPVGVVAADLDLEALSAYLDRLPLMHGTSAAIVTQDGTVVARSGRGRLKPGDRLAGSTEAMSLIKRRDGVAEWRWDDSTPSVVGAAPMSRAPWVALAGVPRDLAYAPAAVRLRWNLFGVGVLMLAALLAAWLISRGMTHSVRTLIDGARGLAAGGGGRITVATGDELAELADQLNHAMEERGLAEAAVAARGQRIRVLADVNRSLSEQLDLEPLLQQITRSLAQLTGAHNVVLWEADRDTGVLTRRAGTTDPSISSVDLPPALTIEQGATGWIARHRQPLFVEDVAREPRMMAADWALRHGLVAFAGAPVVAGDDLLGVLTLNLKAGMLPQGDDRALLSSFASQAAVAIRNARLFAEVDARRRVAETLSDLGRVLAQALDVAVVAQQVADSACALLGTLSSVLYRLEVESGDLISLAVSGDVGPGFGQDIVFPAGSAAVGLCVRERSPVASPNALTDARISLPRVVRDRVEQAPFRAVLALPLVVKDRVIGALSVGDREGRIFDAEEVRIAQALADQAALALDNARLYEEARQRLRHLDSLRQVVDQILVPVSLDERLNLIAGKAVELFGADRGVIALRDADRDELAVRAGYGLPEGEVGRVLSVGTGVLGIAAARREGLLVNDYQNWPHKDLHIVNADGERLLGAVIGCPLLIRDQLIGAIAVGLYTPGKRFAQADLDRLASLAVPAALAIEHGRLYEELAARVREQEETQAQLLQAGKLSAVGQLISGVAHELNNPLSVIVGYGQLLSGRDLPPELRRPVELMLAQGNRMTKIVQSLLLFSRQRKAERGAVDVREAMEQTLGLRATQLMLSGIRVGEAYAENVPAAEGDAHQLQQVFLNLILNAEQAILGSGPPGERVGNTIRVATGSRTERGQTWVVITIADNGPGIPRDLLPHIFEPFFTTKKAGEGTGLGLSVSYGIVQQHGGRLRAESHPGHTVFTVELPALASPARAREVERTVPTGGAGHGRLALVVDDEPGVIDLVTALLGQAGWKVEAATGGRMALERLRASNYDVVVSDIRMPDGSGEELYRAITSERSEMAKRFLFMTGDTANPGVWRFLEEMGAAAIEKPFTAQTLLSAVDRVAT